MSTRNVALTQHQEELIASLVETGRYQNASEVLRAGLRLVERDEQQFDAKLEALREAAQVGWDDLDSGRYFEVRSDDDRKSFWDAVHREVESKRPTAH